MVYCTADGRVLQAKPWSFSSIPDFFKGLFSFVTLFFTTLVGPGTNKKGEGYSTDYRSTGKSDCKNMKRQYYRLLPGGRGGPPGGGPRKRFGGFGGGQGGAASPPPPAGGGG